ncbi:MAG: hypothetical protein IJC09_06040 [Clostridia bacterium]|nr:hypothetical protein [Clostridia bacterium]
MKKVVAGLFACAVVLCGICTFAAESEQDVYFGSDNSVHIGDYNDVDGKEYTTVLIRKAGTTDASGVVYVDQQSGGLGSVMNFMLKDGVEKDKYIATFGNSDGDTKVINFSTDSFVLTGKSGAVTFDRAYKMTVADEPESHENENFSNKTEGDYYKKSFVFTAKAGKIFDKVYLVSADGGTCHGHIELKPIETNFTGDSDIAYGIQIYNISQKDKGINLYLAEKEADAQ